MRKIIAFFLCGVLVFMLSGCKNDENKKQPTDSKTESGETNINKCEADILNDIWAKYSENEKFSVVGGDPKNHVMQSAGMFDITNLTDLKISLAIDEKLAGDLKSGASLIHMLNSNIFTSAVFTLNDDVKPENFAEKYKAAVNSKHWLDGFADKVAIIKLDENIVATVYAVNEMMTPFITHTLEAYPKAEILINEDILF